MNFRFIFKWNSRSINESSGSIGKNILGPLGVTATTSAIDAGVQKKIRGSGTTALIISNEKIDNIFKIFQDLEDSNILLKEITKTMENETKEQKWGFLKNVIIYFWRL